MMVNYLNLEQSSVSQNVYFNRYYYVGENGKSSTIQKTKAEFPQCIVLDPTLYLLFTLSDLPLTDGVGIRTFAGNTAV